MSKDCRDRELDPACLAVALEAFQSAAAAEISPSELARALRELMGDCELAESETVCGELKRFLELDLSDYAYYLAIHDRPALEALKENIRDWSSRLEKEASRRLPLDSAPGA